MTVEATASATAITAHHCKLKHTMMAAMAFGNVMTAFSSNSLVAF
jgi:hypothetical protein